MSSKEGARVLAGPLSQPLLASEPRPVCSWVVRCVGRGDHRVGNLTDRLDGKPLPAREAAKLVEALARAMQLAHNRNVVHRDLEPANVLRSEPFPDLTRAPSPSHAAALPG